MGRGLEVVRGLLGEGNQKLGACHNERVVIKYVKGDIIIPIL